MKQDFNWSLIRSFLAALDCGSLLGAARALHSSQPTIGRHIAELESQLGVVLFERTGRGLLPSDTALRLADAARTMEQGALQLARKASVGETGISGTIRITASQPIACVLLPPLLARMRGVLPGMQVELVVSNAVTNLLRREADIARSLGQRARGLVFGNRIDRQHRAEGFDRASAGRLDQVEHLADHRRRLGLGGRSRIRQQPAGAARDEAVVADAPEDQRGQRAALGVEDQVEMPSRQRPGQEFARGKADTGLLDHLVDQPLDKAAQAAAIDRRALAGEPGDAGVRPGRAQGADEGQLHQPVAEAVEPDIDEDGLRRSGHAAA